MLQVVSLSLLVGSVSNRWFGPLCNMVLTCLSSQGFFLFLFFANEI